MPFRRGQAGNAVPPVGRKPGRHRPARGHALYLDRRVGGVQAGAVRRIPAGGVPPLAKPDRVDEPGHTPGHNGQRLAGSVGAVAAAALLLAGQGHPAADKRRACRL